MIGSDDEVDAYSIYRERGDFEEQNYDELESVRNFWGEYADYGFVNFRGEKVVPSEEFVDTRNVGGQPITLNIVVLDALEDLYERLIKAQESGDVLTDGVVFPISLNRSHKKLSGMYNAHVNKYNRSFVQDYIKSSTQGKEGEIDGPDGYFKRLKEYGNILEKEPFLFEEYVSSFYRTPFMNGMTVEVNQKEKSGDQIVADEFFSHRDFSVFQKIVQKCAFQMDLNSPWRLTFDVSSAEATKYYNQHDLRGPEEFIDTHYTKLRPDIMRFKSLVYNFYNLFASDNAEYREIQYRDGKYCFKRKIRKIVDRESYESDDTKKWVRYYYQYLSNKRRFKDRISYKDIGKYLKYYETVGLDTLEVLSSDILYEQ